MEIDSEKISEVERLTSMVVGSSALTKACFDVFDYALKLRTGEVIRFSDATVLCKDWIHLDLSAFDQPEKDGVPFKAVRGMDVRIADIVWVMDGPEGS